MAETPHLAAGARPARVLGTQGQRGAWRGAELALALLVVAVVAMMIVPLPTWLLDVLIATNLAASVAILLVVLYVPDALAIGTFPTLLLLATLYRLALNVSSSRLILLQANAGEIIHAFGSFVVSGNYVVGAIVFLILTVIQLVVIARGSERVAEVGARFVLDAMPGKQMAIDAELRTGAIDGVEARRRRRELGRESQFYGAMDGAMKFVKGDAAASLFIIVINIVGGLAIGVGQRGLEATVALKRYGLLTIGDGLVTQIPALVLSMAAGVLVTRTASEDSGTPLGEEMARQIFGIPRALGVASGFVLLLSLVPGLPAIPFLVLAAALGFAARARARTIAREERRALAEPPAERADRAAHGPRFVPVVVPWGIELSTDRASLVEAVLTRSLALRETLFADRGVPLPPPRVRVSDALPSGSARVLLFEVPSPVLSVPALPEEGATLVVEHALDLLRRRASDFLGLSETQRLLDELEQLSPAVVRNVVPKPISLSLLTDVLRRLVEEGIPVRDLRAVLEALAVAPASEKDPLALSEHVRAQLRRPITFRLTAGSGQLGVYLLDPLIEDTIRRAVTRTPSGAFLSLSPGASRDVVSALKRAFAQAPPPEGAPMVVLTQPDIRRFVRKLIDVEVPEAQVVSFAELMPEVSLLPLAKADLQGI